MLVVIGDLIQQGVTQNYDSAFGLLIVGRDDRGPAGSGRRGSCFRSPEGPGQVLEGEPIVLVQENGELIARNLRRERLTEDRGAGQLGAARDSIAARADEIAWAILETSGTITFIKKSGS